MQRFEWSGQNIAAAAGRPGQNLAASLIIFERSPSKAFTVCFSVVRLNRSRVTHSHSPIQASVLNRFGDVRGFDIFCAGEIGDRAAEF
jgi:hypothetical protein